MTNLIHLQPQDPFDQEPWRTLRRLAVIPLLLALLHAFFPGLGIDVITVALLLVAASPWLIMLASRWRLLNIELPGGVKVSLEDFRSLELRAEQARVLPPASIPSADKEVAVASRSLLASNPRAALAAQRAHLETAIRQLADAHDVSALTLPSIALVPILQQRDVLQPVEASLLEDLLHLLDKAEQGEEIPAAMAKWGIELTDRFATFVQYRMAKHARRELGELVADAAELQRIAAPPDLPVAPREPVEDHGPGFLELLASAHDGMARGNEAIENLTDAMRDIATQMNLHTEAINELLPDMETPAGLASAKRIMDDVAKDLATYTDRTERDTALLSHGIRNALGAYAQAADIWHSDVEPDDEQREALVRQLGQMQEFHAVIAPTLGMVGSFRQTVAGLPRFTQRLSEERARALRVLERLEAALRDIASTAKGVVDQLEKQLEAA